MTAALIASTSTWNVILIIAGAVWAPLLGVGLFRIWQQRTKDDHEYRMQRMLEESRHFRQREESGLGDTARRLESFLPELMERLPRRVAESVDKNISAELNEIRKITTELQSPRLTASSPTEDQQALLREISHALNTPLSQAEAAAVSALHELDTGDADPLLRQQLRQVPISVTMCKAFLFAFRLLASGETMSEHGSAVALGPAIHEAAHLYLAREQREAQLKVPDSTEIPGYDSSYVLAAILPLIENAAESVPSGGCIEITQTDSPSGTVISVANPIEGDLQDRIYEPGLTTKAGHDGLGLATVRRLLQGADGDLSHSVENGVVTFTITFPVRTE